MNRDTAIENREVYNAFCDGKTIQSLDKEGLGLWFDDSSPNFSCFYDWRVKPEPEVIYINKRLDSDILFVHRIEDIALAAARLNGETYEYTAKKFIEVQDND